MAQTPEGIQKAEKDMESEISDINEDRAAYEKLISSPEEKTLYIEFSKQFEHYLEINKEVLALSRENKTVEAEKIMRKTKQDLKIKDMKLLLNH